MLVLALVAALAAADAPPADPPTTVAPANVKGAKAAADKDPNRMVCKSQPTPGSRMATRVCATQLQWDRNEEASRQFMRDSQSKAGIGETGPSQGMRTP